MSARSSSHSGRRWSSSRVTSPSATSRPTSRSVTLLVIDQPSCGVSASKPSAYCSATSSPSLSTSTARVPRSRGRRTRGPSRRRGPAPPRTAGAGRRGSGIGVRVGARRHRRRLGQLGAGRRRACSRSPGVAHAFCFARSRGCGPGTVSSSLLVRSTGTSGLGGRSSSGSSRSAIVLQRAARCGRRTRCRSAAADAATSSRRPVPPAGDRR